MLRNFYPSCRVKNVFQIDYAELYENGYRGILFDIDNTLVHHGDDSTEAIDNLFQRIHQTGLKTVMLSNNSEDRIKRFIRNIDTLYVADAGKPKYIYKAGKPKPSGYRTAMKRLGTDTKNTLFVGDQIFTDIYGANKCGIDSILVDFIRLPEEKWFGKRRILEKIILKCCDIQRGGKIFADRR